MKLRTSILPALGMALLTTTAYGQPGMQQFERLDRNRDGRITRDEFNQPLFDRIDRNGDGVIWMEEVRAFMQQRAAGQQQGGEQQRPGAQQTPARISDKIRAELDIPYAGTNNPRQRLDLYLPKQPANDQPLAVIAYVHGGGWQSGDKRGGLKMVAPLLESGEYAGVSIGYRLSGEATWPAQIHDCKAAIRWLRANAAKYHLDPDRIGVVGTSAGGHLVSLLGTAGDVAELEGTLGDHTDTSSQVACVVDMFGPADLLAMRGRHDNPDAPEARLIGGTVQQNRRIAEAASPISYVSKDDPPFLLIHGTEDGTVPYSQSESLLAALRKSGVKSTLVPVTGGGHGGFTSDEVPQRMKQFFDRHLLERDLTISDEPISSGPVEK